MPLFRDAIPRLDPAELPHPGWLFDVEVGIPGEPRLNHVGQTDLSACRIRFRCRRERADGRLDWTVSPRFELGYRLPSGFGEVDVAYRFLSAQGTRLDRRTRWPAPDATAALRSHLDINVGDLDYASRETSLGACWRHEMAHRPAVPRTCFSIRRPTSRSQAAAPAGSGIFERSISNNFWGIGPHAALELNTAAEPVGPGMGRPVGRRTALRRGPSNDSPRYRPAGLERLVTDLGNPQQVPMLSGFLGLDWRPPCRPNLDVLLGYTAEYWWNVGRLSDPDIYNGHSAGEMGSHGPVLRLEYNY